MSEEEYPYATLEKDGYELEAVETSNWKGHGFLGEPVPADEARFAVEKGHAVKCIFHYQEPVSRDGKSFPSEHMWLVVTETEEGVITAILDNDPHYTNLLKPGSVVTLHPEHIISIWTGR
mgnify:CR=1 FL=1